MTWHKMPEEADIVVGRLYREHLAVKVLGRPYPDGADWDFDWLDLCVHVTTGPWTGEFTSRWRAEEIGELRSQLAELYERLNGSVHFKPLEPYVEITFEGDGRGHINITCVMRTEPLGENQLSFQHGMDQTELKTIIESLQQIETAFPVMKPGDWREHFWYL